MRQRRPNQIYLSDTCDPGIVSGLRGARLSNSQQLIGKMPVGSKDKELLIWDGIIQRSEKKLAIWKSQILVLEKFNKPRRDFLWFGNKERKGYYLVSWETVQLPKLSVSLDEMAVEICGRRTSSLEISYTSQVWPGLPMQSNIILAESWANGWDISFMRHFNDWEINRVAQLLHVINEFNYFAARPDTVPWVHSEDGRFTFNKLYKKELKLSKALDWLDGNMYGQAKHQPRSNVVYVAESGEEEVKAKKSGGELFQRAYGGQYGRKEMEDAMRTNQTPYRKLKKIVVLHICIFGVNRNV
ncbi:hypothetical protein H5410_011326 [Solanum commersonii]|uniref:Uncharacterized protein n=1 Tax=Solanum commersonii TaxID=4109 RepID=A0A9J6AP21_SOLCO|nr:hypothetical protein H5410_011326 [Solanum commersonii]